MQAFGGDITPPPPPPAPAAVQRSAKDIAEDLKDHAKNNVGSGTDDHGNLRAGQCRYKVAVFTSNVRWAGTAGGVWRTSTRPTLNRRTESARLYEHSL